MVLEGMEGQAMGMNTKFTLAFTWVAGLMDSATGLLLIFFPAFTLQLMRVPAVVADMVFIQFVGAFVMAVGSTYFIGLITCLRSGDWQELKTVWKVTAFVRLVIFLFCTGVILTGRLDIHWVSVPVTDASLAIFQIYWIRSRHFPA
jgi:hypothetical protein